MVDGVECARIVSETPWELEIPMGPGMTLQEGGDTTVVSLFDYEAGRILNEVFEFSMKVRAGTAELTMMEMEFSIRGESEVQ
jgi:hypothetical protein